MHRNRVLARSVFWNVSRRMQLLTSVIFSSSNIRSITSPWGRQWAMLNFGWIVSDSRYAFSTLVFFLGSVFPRKIDNCLHQYIFGWSPGFKVVHGNDYWNRCTRLLIVLPAVQHVKDSFTQNCETVIIFSQLAGVRVVLPSGGKTIPFPDTRWSWKNNVF